MKNGKNLLDYSNPVIAQKNTEKYLGKNKKLFISKRKDKKYYVKNPDGRKVYFGAMGYKDFTKHNDLERRKNYLKRSAGIKGYWENDKYSPNNLSRNILWN